MSLPCASMAVCLFILAGTLNCSAAPQETSAGTSQLDFNEDGYIDYDELIFGLTRKEKGTGDILTVRQAKKAPPAPAARELDPAIYDAYQDVVDGISLAPGSTVTRPRWAVKDIPPASVGMEKPISAAPTDAQISQQRYLHDFTWKLRRTQDDLDKDLEDTYAQAAFFSYAYDFNKEEDQWAARGVLSLEWSSDWNRKYKPEISPTGEPVSMELSSTDTHLRWARYGVMLDFNKISTGGSDRDEVDSLDFIGSARFSWFLRDVKPLTGVILALGVHYNTDFEFDKRVFAGTIDLKPRTTFWGHGSFTNLPPGDTDKAFLRVRWFPTLHAELGRVEEAASSTNLRKYEDFQRLGGGLETEFILFPKVFDNRLTLAVSYSHFEGLSDDVPSTHLFKAAAQFVFATGSGIFATRRSEGETPTRTEKDVTWTLRAEYTNGTAPLVEEDDHHMLVGFGVAF